MEPLEVTLKALGVSALVKRYDVMVKLLGSRAATLPTMMRAAVSSGTQNVVTVGVGGTQPPVNVQIARLVAPTDVQRRPPRPLHRERTDPLPVDRLDHRIDFVIGKHSEQCRQNAVERFGGEFRETVHPKLFAKARVLFVVAAHTQTRTYRNAGQRTDHRHQVGLVFDLQTYYRKRAVVARVDNAFDGAFDHMLRFVLPTAGIVLAARPIKQVHGNSALCA